MKYLIHGDDTASSRKFLVNVTEEYKVTTIDGKGVNPKILDEHLISTSLFNEKKALVIENLFFKANVKKEVLQILNITRSIDLIVLWENKKLSKTVTNSLKDFAIREYSYPAYYFQFLDSFTPTQKKKVFILYQELLNTYAPELLLFSLLKRIRLLVILRSNSTTEEIAKMPTWMLSKLQSQAQQWPLATLLNIYKTLQQTEVKLKTGNLPTDLAKHLDILILSQL